MASVNAYVTASESDPLHWRFGEAALTDQQEFSEAARNTDFAALAERLERAEKENREIVSVVRSLVMRPYMSRHQAIVDAEGKAMAILKRYEETEADQCEK